MVHNATYFAISLVYLTAFATAFPHVTGKTAAEKIKACPYEHYCHLMLAVLYPVSTIG